MSGIYIHIPFCKQACYYCDFHFSTSLKRKEEMIQALLTEIELRKQEFVSDTVATIYFGGGTPSVLNQSEIETIIDAVYQHYNVIDEPEITLEANPDDLTEERIAEIAKSLVNRLSIGIQSFFEKDLKLMNRAHNAEEAKKCLSLAVDQFENISIDLIYGIPNTTHEEWRENISTALSFGVPHISSYALTVEPKTALESFIQKGVIDNVNDEVAQQQFLILVEELDKAGFVHYELSNFGKEGYFSKNNSAYWQGKKYIGIGPSAHSFNGKERSWNIANNALYIKKIQEKELPSEVEELSNTDRYNEYVMTGLRTVWGVSFHRVAEEFGRMYLDYLKMQAEKFILEDLLYIEDDTLRTTTKGKFLTDGIASDLFKLNLS
ncbi:radical SAM family heme chaperone HemW [Tenacibaculum agarivorans]|uniref:radical SAM family heme chaperone HemW n=1 Tax=Tenacibaculum agarivorans TaxID=1908389 RepID=UPI00094B7F6A|nr:radical SAM family heme chaperone HemW [Tenacibaculum agarivorans]